MQINTFELERYFARHEFSARYLLSCSDCEAMSMSELIETASPDIRKQWDELKLGYTETCGHPLLREMISSIYHRIKREELLVAAPEECIFLSMHTLLQRGDHFICTYPGYQSLYEVGRSIGAQVSYWKAEETSDGWKFDIERLENLIKSNTRLIVVNFPHNPTGYVPGRDIFEKIVQLAEQNEIWLFSDEMYRFLELNGTDTLPAACELYDRGISLFGLSKTFGLPGLRIGWIACRNISLLDSISSLKDYTTICNSAPSEILAMMAMEKREEIISRQRRRLENNLNILESFCINHGDVFSLNRPKGGSICFPRLILNDDAESFCRHLVSEANIMLVPSSIFGFGNHHVRIGFGRDEFSLALNELACYLGRKR